MYGIFYGHYKNSLVYVRTTYITHCSINKTRTIVKWGPFIILVKCSRCCCESHLCWNVLKRWPQSLNKKPNPALHLRQYITRVLVEQICKLYLDICMGKQSVWRICGKLQQNHKLLYYYTWKHQLIVKYLLAFLYCQEKISALFCTHLHSMNLGQNFRSSSMANRG